VKEIVRPDLPQVTIMPGAEVFFHNPKHGYNYHSKFLILADTHITNNYDPLIVYDCPRTPPGFPQNCNGISWVLREPIFHKDDHGHEREYRRGVIFFTEGNLLHLRFSEPLI
jgi:hypothetical protein